MKKDGHVCLVAPGSDVCWALSSSDTAPVMIALGAEVTLVGPKEERRIAVRDLYGPDGIAYLAKRPDEILTRIHVPDRTGLGDDLSQAAPSGVDRLPDPRRGRRRPARGGRTRGGGAHRPGGGAHGARRRARCRGVPARPRPRRGDDRDDGGDRLQAGASRSTTPTSPTPGASAWRASRWRARCASWPAFPPATCRRCRPLESGALVDRPRRRVLASEARLSRPHP